MKSTWSSAHPPDPPTITSHRTLYLPKLEGLFMMPYSTLREEVAALGASTFCSV